MSKVLDMQRIIEAYAEFTAGNECHVGDSDGSFQRSYKRHLNAARKTLGTHDVQVAREALQVAAQSAQPTLIK